MQGLVFLVIVFQRRFDVRPCADNIALFRIGGLVHGYGVIKCSLFSLQFACKVGHKASRVNIDTRKFNLRSVRLFGHFFGKVLCIFRAVVDDVFHDFPSFYGVRRVSIIFW